MRGNFWAAMGVALCLICLTPAFAATQSPQEWTTNVVAGTFPSQQAALSAMRAQGGIYALAENVEKVIQSGTTVTFVYGAIPRGPTVGPWTNYTLAGCGDAKASEAEVVACAEAGYARHSSCPSGTATSSTGWQPYNTFPDGSSVDETRTYQMMHYPNSDCARMGPSAIQGWRRRVVECPTGLAWNGTEGACVKNDIARITSRPMACSPCDLQSNPVNINTGDKYQAETDVVLPWITLTRHYHSSYSVPGARLGAGWTHSLNMQVSMNGASGGLLLPNGDTLPIQNDEAVDGSGWKVTSLPGAYKVVQPTQVLTFNIQGKLTSIDGLNGGVTTLQYDAAGRLATATHSSGRSLTFQYESSVAVSKARLIAVMQDGVDSTLKCNVILVEEYLARRQVAEPFAGSIV